MKKSFLFIFLLILVSCSDQKTSNKKVANKKKAPVLADSITVVFYTPIGHGRISDFVDSVYVVNNLELVKQMVKNINDSSFKAYSCCPYHGEILGHSGNVESFSFGLSLTPQGGDIRDTNYVYFAHPGYQYSSRMSKSNWQFIISNSNKLFVKPMVAENPKKARNVLQFCKEHFLQVDCPDRELAENYDGYFLFESIDSTLERNDIYWKIRKKYGIKFDIALDSTLTNIKSDVYKCYCTKSLFSKFDLYRKKSSFIQFPVAIRIFSYSSSNAGLDSLILNNSR